MGTEELMRCVIISAGELTTLENMNFELFDDDFIICADGGYSHAKRLGIKCDIIMGDMDSFFGELPKDIPHIDFDSHKDDTDTMLAIREGMRRGYKDFVLLGALGGRLDHTYANIQSLCYILENGASGSIISDTTSIFMIKNTKRTITQKNSKDYALSVFSYSNVCEGVYLRGLLYPLENATVKRDFPIGVSNKFLSDNAEVEVGEGTLLIMISKNISMI